MKVNTKNTFLAALALGLLLASIAGTAGAAFPGANGKIAFQSDRDGNPEVYVMNSDGSGQTRLTNEPRSDVEPAFSPDGTRIAFVSQRNGGGLHVMDADGSGPIRLTSDLEGGSKPAFSPDGAEIAFVGIQTGFDIFTMNADGSGPIRLTDDPSKDLDPDWQPLVGSGTPPFDFEGFFSPVDNLPTLNAMKAGRGVPVNFSLNGDRGLDVFAEGFPKSQQVACDSTAEVDGIEETVTAGGSSLSYDANVDQYTYVWKTEKAWVGTCRQMVVKLEDDSFHRANFRFK